MRRALPRLAAFAVISIALIGVMHMPFARNLLRSAGGCPFPTTDRILTATEAEQLRQVTLAPSRKLPPAPARPALGFLLERATRSDIRAWAKAHALTCHEDRHGAGVTCDDVPASALPEARTSDVRGVLMLGFAPNAKLVSVHYLGRDRSRDAVMSRSDAAAHTFASLSMPSEQSGNPRLDRPLSQVHRRVAFRDYAADVLATNLGNGFTISESYQAFAP